MFDMIDALDARAAAILSKREARRAAASRTRARAAARRAKSARQFLALAFV